MTSERRVSLDDSTSCESVSTATPMLAVVHADRRSRSVDSGLVTDVDLPQRALTAVPVSWSAPLGSCDSGLPQHVEHDGDTRDLLQDRLSDVDCDCSAAVSSPQHPQHVDDGGTSRTSPPVSVTLTRNRQSWLLRLFESRLFDMSIAIQYLFNSKESGVQTYIGESSGCNVLLPLLPFSVCFSRRTVSLWSSSSTSPRNKPLGITILAFNGPDEALQGTQNINHNYYSVTSFLCLLSALFP